MANLKPVKLFYSYSHKDEKLRDELEKHLSILKRQGTISEWHDRKISAGSEWADSIDQNLVEADIILLLISSDFLASDYCYDIELKNALERHEQGDCRVVPIILRAVDWVGAPFGKLQALPKDAKPVISWENHDEAFANITQGIRATIKEIPRATSDETITDIVDVLKGFKLRPKKYRGQEIVAKVKLGDHIFSIDSDNASSFYLTLGDAIKRTFDFLEPKDTYNKMYAEGKLADWLETAKEGNYKVKLKLIYGTYDDYVYTESGTSSKTETMLGYQLMDVFEE